MRGFREEEEGGQHQDTTHNTLENLFLFHIF